LDVAIDLAFIVRLQQFFVRLHQHLLRARDNQNVNDKASAREENNDWTKGEAVSIMTRREMWRWIALESSSAAAGLFFATA
jgi:hypothetical protein